MKTISEKISALNEMVLGGRPLEAFETFYHPDVAMQENDLPPTRGKEANRQREIEFFSNVTDLRTAEVRGVATGKDMSAVIWYYDYNHKQWGERKYTQVSVQQWKDGLIIHEQFFYGN